MNSRMYVIVLVLAISASFLDVPTTTKNTNSSLVQLHIFTTTGTPTQSVVTPDDRTMTRRSHLAGATTNSSTKSTVIGNAPYDNTLDNGCCGECCVTTNESGQLHLEELKRIVEELKSQLAFNKIKWSANRRKLISINDSRPSSVAIGSVAITILVVFLSIIVIPDMANLVKFL